MRRSQVDEARQRQSAAERRFRGRRIRGGLEELGDLDAAAASAPPTQRQRRDLATPATAETRAAAASARVSTLGDAPLLGSSSVVSTTVFGTDWAEWVEVKRRLFDLDATAEVKRRALERIKLWHLRARKEREMPPYVEATEVLLDAMLQDEVDALADGPQRLCYGAAISRVVHVMTGSFASGSADTYRKRAHEIGFPEEAVEVRQRVAHGALPLASELRWVCGLVLQFLFTEYWQEQERQLYIMQQADKAPVDVAPTDVSTSMQKKRRKGSEEERSAAPPTAPPSVSVAEMKALLADLEGDEKEEEGVAAKIHRKSSLSTTTADGEIEVEATEDASAAAKTGEIQGTTLINGWLLS